MFQLTFQILAKYTFPSSLHFERKLQILIPDRDFTMEEFREFILYEFKFVKKYFKNVMVNHRRQYNKNIGKTNTKLVLGLTSGSATKQIIDNYKIVVKFE